MGQGIAKTRSILAAFDFFEKGMVAASRNGGSY
jgi:hypothetical protein